LEIMTDFILHRHIPSQLGDDRGLRKNQSPDTASRKAPVLTKTGFCLFRG
jgi:hypothetical protein